MFVTSLIKVLMCNSNKNSVLIKKYYQYTIFIENYLKEY